MSLELETHTATDGNGSSLPSAKSRNKETWEEIGARKRAALLASIPKEWRVPADLLPPDSQDDVTTWPATSGWFTADELAITELSASELVPKLASGALKSVVVTKAFCKRAAAAHQLVCVLLHHTIKLLTKTQNRRRQTVLARLVSLALSKQPRPVMNIWLAQGNPWDPCMGCLCH